MGAEFDTADFIGLTCKLEVVHETYTNKYGEEVTKAKVSQLYPLGAGSDEPPF